jgi:hypothetical protein
MVKDYPGEQWKTIEFDLDITNGNKIEVSNFGRIRTFNKLSDGNIIRGGTINGYKIMRLKLFKPREEKDEKHLIFLKEQAGLLSQKLKDLKKKKADMKQIEETAKMLQGFKQKISHDFKQDVKKRTIHYHALFHRLVAEYFCEKPSDEHTLVSHLDHDKQNNKHTNLKWMTVAENAAHQQLSPNVIEKKLNNKTHRNPNSKVNKLTVTKVMLLKKLLNQGKPLKTLVKQFKVTDTQILRIKRGENWANIEAAP